MRKKTLKTLIYNVFPINVILILPPLPVLLGLVLVTLLRISEDKFSYVTLLDINEEPPPPPPATFEPLALEPLPAPPAPP